jgi:Flp pilus assembly protein TadG
VLSALRHIARGKFARSERAATAVEFALIAPIFIAFIFAVLQYSVVFLAKSYLETVTETAARLVQTNQTNNLTQAQFTTKVCGLLGAFFSCGNLIVQLGPAPTTAAQIPASLPQFSSSGTLLNPTTYGYVAPPSKMLLVVMYEWPVYGGPLGLYLATFSNNTMLMSSTQIFQTEINNNG